jgi:hypothetical protein
MIDIRSEPAAEGPMDQKTRALVIPIAPMTHTIEVFYEAWHKDRFSFEIIKAAVNVALDYHRPKGEPVLNFDSKKPLIDVYGQTNQPDVIGRILAMTELTGWATGKKP